MPGVLGRTCARPCEPVCRRNKIDGKPIAICWLNVPPPTTVNIVTTLSDRRLRKRRKSPLSVPVRWAACARDLREMGYPVALYDDYPVAGGVMVNGIPVWRLPRTVTREECDEYMDEIGVEMITTRGLDAISRSQTS